jgi:hypothetical protein
MMRLIALLAALLRAASARATSYSSSVTDGSTIVNARLNSDPFWAGSPL